MEACNTCKQLKCKCSHRKNKCSKCKKSKKDCKCKRCSKCGHSKSDCSCKKCKKCGKRKDKCDCKKDTSLCKSCFRESGSKKCDCKKSSHSCSSEEKKDCKKCGGCGFSSCSCKCKDQGFCAGDIYAKHRDAVVRIQTLTSLTTSGYAAGVPSVLRPFVTYGNGFFVSGRRIVCPASLVLLPPTVSVNFNRFPFTSTSVTAPTGSYQDERVKVGQIFVEVDNPEEHDRNGKNGRDAKKTFSYVARLEGVDGAADVAVLRIYQNDPGNRDNPCIKRKKHFLSWGQSRNYCPGNKIFAIGDPFIPITGIQNIGGAKNVILEGILNDDNYVDHSGWALAPMLAASFNVFSTRVGMPILDRWGRVIAMQTTSTPGIAPEATEGGNTQVGQGVVAGPTQYFLTHILESLICASKNFGPNTRLPDRVELQTDLLGNYYYYEKQYLGIGYNIFKPIDYVTTFNGTTTPSQQFNSDGSFITPPDCKQILGIKVVALAGEVTISGAIVPGASVVVPPYPSLVDSPLLGTLGLGDMVFAISGCPLGDLGNQQAPGLATWFHSTNKPFTIRYRSFATNFKTDLKVSIAGAEFPAFMDYPWYQIHNMQLMTSVPVEPAGPFMPAV